MSRARKVKISVTLDPAVLAAIDRYAARTGISRSTAMEGWLRRSSGAERRDRLEEETAAYYDSLTSAERMEDANWVAAAGASAAKLDFDDTPKARPGQSRARRAKKR